MPSLHEWNHMVQCASGISSNEPNILIQILDDEWWLGKIKQKAQPRSLSLQPAIVAKIQGFLVVLVREERPMNMWNEPCIFQG
jgi:hypothetical protein